MSGPYQVWVDFFDDNYRKFYAGLLHPVRTEFEVASVVSLLSLREGARVLDLCCGDGRHAIPLQRRGMKVCGVDLAAPMLRAAQRRGLSVLGEESAQPLWVQADGGRLPLRAAFDAVVMLYNSISFGTRAMTESMLANARAALRPGGQILIECTHRDHEARAASTEEDIEEMDGLPGETGPLRIERWFDPIAGEQHARMTFEQGGEVREKHLRYLVYTAGELKALLESAGFSNVELFGGYDARPFGLNTPAVLRARA